MKDCGEYQELISLMLDGELAEPQKTGLLRHIEECPDCSRVYSAFKAISLSLSEEEEAPPGLAHDVMAAIKDGNVSPMPAEKRRRGWKPRLAALAACLVLVLAGAAALPSLRAGSSAEEPAEAEPAAFGMMGGTGDEAAPADGGEEESGVTEDAVPESEGTADVEKGLHGSSVSVSPRPFACTRTQDVTAAQVYRGGELLLDLGVQEAPSLASLLEYAGPYGGEMPEEGGFSVSLSAGGGEYELEVYVVGGGLACSCSGRIYTAAGSAEDFLEAVGG